MTESGRIRPPALALHVGKLITQRGDATLCKPGRNGLHRSMLHAGTGPMCQNEHRPRRARTLEQCRDPTSRIDFDRQALIDRGPGHDVNQWLMCGNDAVASRCLTSLAGATSRQARSTASVITAFEAFSRRIRTIG